MTAPDAAALLAAYDAQLRREAEIPSALSAARVGPILLAHEDDMRRALRVYLDTWLRNRRNGSDDIPAVREGRRMRWLDTALEPVQDLPDENRRRLRAALALTIGIDSIVVMKDVCGLDDDEALAIIRWVAIALLRAGLDEGRAGHGEVS